eukprot:TRINITY_DN58166_c0_g1_i1.p1 TRINITY_DN58166_c0_g1~~TRINITY_DN58166_c0_g1_i1.p1  ORF type:complete len:163 (-),score=12.81 TRINITY_DN58166_c0_g1_i1:74-562(-)
MGLAPVPSLDVEVLVLLPATSPIPEPARLVRVDASSAGTVADLMNQVLADQGLSLGSEGTASMVFNGVELDPQAPPEHCGIKGVDGHKRGISNFIFPNGWHTHSVLRRPLMKVLSYGWPVTRYEAPVQPFLMSTSSAFLPPISISVWAFFLILGVIGILLPA